MQGALIAILLAVASLGLVYSAPADYQRTCYDPGRNFYPYFSTRTAYKWVHGNVSRAENSCTPVQLWMLARHGAKYPGKKIVSKFLNVLPKMRDQIVKNHEEGAGRLCDEDLQKLKNWKPDQNINDEMAEKLAPQGIDDLRLLAQRLQRAFPELLQVDARSVKPDDYVFRSTNTQRAQESLNSFARGLFGSSEVVTVTEPPANDTLLQPHVNYPAWKNSHGPAIELESEKFATGSEMQSVLRDIGQRLGYDAPLNFDTLKLMYEICRYEIALTENRTSIWCSFFNKEELKIMEYYNDLHNYYYCGPARALSAKIACPLLNDMFQHFKHLESGATNEPKGIFYFGHTVTLQVFLTALKIGYESKPLLASTYAASENRKYRTSMLGPFTTNVVAVFYRCNNIKSPNKVTFHVAERMTQIVSCEKDGTCDWKSLEHEFEEEVNTCDI